MKKIFAVIIALMLLASACLAEAVTVDAHYPTTHDRLDGVLPTEYDFGIFENASSAYNHTLARMSLITAMVAFRLSPDGDDYSDTDINLRSLCADLGCTDYEAYGYHEATSDNSISNAIAAKQLSDSVLLIVPVCGQNYMNEWAGNFNLGSGDEHEGFATAADTVYTRVKDYITTHGLENTRVKVWAMGFSRAAAVSNLVGARLLEDDFFNDDDIFIYTFGTPNNTKTPVAYPQIFNICGSSDPMPRIPFSEWGYGKNGVTLYLPSDGHGVNYDLLFSNMSEAYSIVGDVSDTFVHAQEETLFIDRLLEVLCENVEGTEVYTVALQDAFTAALNTQGSLTDKLTAFAAQVKADKLSSKLYAALLSFANDLLDSTAEGDEAWMNGLASGTLMVHEHYPEMYLAWLLCTDDYDLLYDTPGELTVTYTGDLSCDAENSVRMGNRTYLLIPLDAIETTLDVTRDTQAKLTFRPISSGRVLAQTYTSNRITLYKDETLAVSMDDDGEVQVKLDNMEEALLPLTEDTSKPTLLTALSGWTSYGMILILWVLLGAAVFIYALVTLIKHGFRGNLEDRVRFRPAGRWVLYLAALMAFSIAVGCGFELVTNYGALRYTNRTLIRVSELLGVSRSTARWSRTVVYLAFAVLCVFSVNHELSRIRLLRLSAAVLIITTVSLFASVVVETVTVYEVLELLIPLTALAGVAVARIPEPGDIDKGKRWLPVSRAYSYAGMFFFARQIYLYLGGIQSAPAVVLKILSGLPALILALYMFRKRRADVTLHTLLAMVCYFAANVITNFLPWVSVAVFGVGHLILAHGYVRTVRPGRSQLIAAVIICAVAAAETRLLLPFADAYRVLCLGVYAVCLCVCVVSAYPVSKFAFAGLICFALSNQLLICEAALATSFLTESIELMFFYIAMVTLAVDKKALFADRNENN